MSVSARIKKIIVELGKSKKGGRFDEGDVVLALHSKLATFDDIATVLQQHIAIASLIVEGTVVYDKTRGRGSYQYIPRGADEIAEMPWNDGIVSPEYETDASAADVYNFGANEYRLYQRGRVETVELENQDLREEIDRLRAEVAVSVDVKSQGNDSMEMDIDGPYLSLTATIDRQAEEISMLQAKLDLETHLNKEVDDFKSSLNAAEEKVVSLEGDLVFASVLLASAI